MDPSIIFEELVGPDGWAVGIATLNRPRALNGLSLDMCRALQTRLHVWATDPRIAVVVLRGNGPRAFCAGGDIKTLYAHLPDVAPGRPWDNSYARDFFETEYRLDYFIHTYPKPVVCWGHGIVMGGGVGLMLGASFRIVTESTRLAMPEISIGLYPDVAASWMLARLPGPVGRFMALTGCQLTADDCVHYGFADRILADKDQQAVLEALMTQRWSVETHRHRAQVDDVLDRFQAPPAVSVGALQRLAPEVRHACGRSDLRSCAQALETMVDHSDPWLAQAARTFSQGAPGSARLALTLQQWARHRSLADVFRTEYVVSLHCCAQPDLREGIRARLIDKDGKPKWQPADIAQASSTWVQQYFRAPWPAGEGHPMADLGEAMSGDWLA